MDKWTTGKVTPVAHLPTAPATTATASDDSVIRMPRLDPVRSPPRRHAEPSHDEVGSFSMMTATAASPLVGSNSMKKWAQFA